KYNPTALIENSLIGGISFRGYEGDNFNRTSAGIYARTSVNFNNSNIGTELQFNTTPDGSTTIQVAAIMHDNGDFETTGTIKKTGGLASEFFMRNGSTRIVASPGAWYNRIPEITTGGALEIGKF